MEKFFSPTNGKERYDNVVVDDDDAMDKRRRDVPSFTEQFLFLLLCPTLSTGSTILRLSPAYSHKFKVKVFFPLLLYSQDTFYSTFVQFVQNSMSTQLLLLSLAATVMSMSG